MVLAGSLPNAGVGINVNISTPSHCARELVSLRAQASLHDAVCDASMYHMKKASIRELRYAFNKIERLLRQGEEIQITRRRRVIARLIPERRPELAKVPDFLARMRAIFGDKVFAESGADMIARDRSRY